MATVHEFHRRAALARHCQSCCARTTRSVPATARRDRGCAIAACSSMIYHHACACACACVFFVPLSFFPRPCASTPISPLSATIPVTLPDHRTCGIWENAALSHAGGRRGPFLPLRKLRLRQGLRWRHLHPDGRNHVQSNAANADLCSARTKSHIKRQAYVYITKREREREGERERERERRTRKTEEKEEHACCER